MKGFWQDATEIYTNWEILTKTLSDFLAALDFDLLSHPRAGTLESEVKLWMPTPQGNDGPNMNGFWLEATEIYNTWEM